MTLLEWPDRAAGRLPADRLDVALTLSPPQGETFRYAQVTGYGTFAARAERISVIRRFLHEAGFGLATRQRIQGDASTRSYERLTLDGASYILMNSPRRPDGPPVRGGKPYSAIAHLAEDVTPFIAMAKGLRTLGLSAPAIFAADRAAGLLVLEDLGNELVVEGDPPAPIEARYEAATDVLAALHRERTHDTISVEQGVQYQLPRYDLDAMLIEVELLLDWFFPLIGHSAPPSARDSFTKLWSEALAPALAAPPTWVLRDFHSPNLLWLPERDGVARVGLLDFQDAMMGPAAYDVASLLFDARVDVPELLEIALLSRYTRARMKADPKFDAPGFARLYATMGAQRASKILGIFARLDRRDGKPQYLRHLPRVWSYLQRCLAHPDLAALDEWYRVNIPPPKIKANEHDAFDRHGACRRLRPAHAPAHRQHAEAVGESGGQGAARSCARPAGRRGRRARHRQCALPRRTNRSACRLAHASEGDDLRRARRFARHRRRRGQGAAVARPRAVLPHQFRHDLDRQRQTEPDAACRTLRRRHHGRAPAARAHRRQHRL